jgi:hypothetical protein
MANTRISKEVVFQMAQQLAAQGEKISVAKIRSSLGTGSNSTIHKYLAAWKLERFTSPPADRQLATRVLALEQLLGQQSVQAEKMLQQQISLEKQCLALEIERDELMQQTAAQATELQQLATQVATGETLLAELKAERQSAIAAIIQDKNALLADLNQELQHIHSSSLELIRDTSAKGHDLLMEVKVAKINLEEKLKIQTQQLASISKELIEARIAQQALRQKLKFAELQTVDTESPDA